MDIAKLDRFMQARPAQEEGVRWLAPFEPPLVLEGFAFFEQNGAYRRLPLDSDAVFSRGWRDLPFSSRTAHTAACSWIPTRYFPAPGEPPSPSWAQIQRAAASVFAAVRDACLSEHVLRLLAPCTTCPPPDRAVLTAICAGRAAHGVTPGPVCSATEKPHIPPHCGAEGTGRKRNF